MRSDFTDVVAGVGWGASVELAVNLPRCIPYLLSVPQLSWGTAPFSVPIFITELGWTGTSPYVTFFFPF